MNLKRAFDRWSQNPNPRTHAELVRSMGRVTAALDDAGVQEHWHEELGVSCHDELLMLIQDFGGVDERRLVAA